MGKPASASSSACVGSVVNVVAFTVDVTTKLLVCQALFWKSAARKRVKRDFKVSIICVLLAAIRRNGVWFSIA